MSKIELIHGDCMDYMRECPDNAFDLAICDPPYGIGTAAIKNAKNKSKLALAGQHKHYANNKSDRPTEEYYKLLKKVSINRIIWGANHLCGSFDASSAGWIVWDKNTTGDYSDCELAYSSFDIPLKKYKYTWNGMIQGDHGDKRLNEKRIHVSQKPVKLYDWLLRNYAEPGQRILDTHLGSGSSAIAAHYFGVDFVGIEIDEDYYKAAVERFDNETRQETLF